MPRKLIRALFIAAGWSFALGVCLWMLAPLISNLFDLSLWKLRVGVAVPFLLIIGIQVWKMYCGMVRDGHWLFDELNPRRRKW